MSYSKTTSKMTTLPLTYKKGNCYINAFINSRHTYKGKNLKVIIGSLGANGWFEYGGKKWGLKEFEKKIVGHCSDSHCWLEDADGNVYDCLFDEYSEWAVIRTGKPLKRTGILEGVSKAELLKDGIEYVPAPKDAQTKLFLTAYPLMTRAEKGLMDGSCRWCGTYLQEAYTAEEALKALATGMAHIPGMEDATPLGYLNHPLAKLLAMCK